MREHKFRVFDKKDVDMITYDRGNWNISLDGQVIFQFDGKITYFKRDRFILMEFTGLKDKNGKEIYEGDIVELHNWGINNKEPIGNAEVVYDKQTAKFDFRMINGDYIEDEYDRFRTTPLVIGNIYKNPDLLECLKW